MIKQGSTVKVHYTGKFEDDKVFDSSEGKQPIEFIVGDKQVIEGFENAVIGLEKGGKVTVNIVPEKAYGVVREELIITVPKNSVPSDVQIGSLLQGVNQTGEPFNVLVKEIKENDVLLDANHPLAGKTLNFEIEVVDFK